MSRRMTVIPPVIPVHENGLESPPYFNVKEFQSLFLIYGLITNAEAFPGVR